MEMMQKQITEAKLCFYPNQINNILERIDTDPNVGPKGLNQIEFYQQLISTLRYGGELMDITVTRDVPVPPPDHIRHRPMPPQEVPVDKATPVWSSEDVPEADFTPVAQDECCGEPASEGPIS